MVFPKLCQAEKSQPKQRRLFSFSRPWPWAHFSNGPNAAAPVARTLIRHCLFLAYAVRSKAPQVVGLRRRRIYGTVAFITDARLAHACRCTAAGQAAGESVFGRDGTAAPMPVAVTRWGRRGGGTGPQIVASLPPPNLAVLLRHTVVN